jgi:hypothetical protein
VHTVSQHPDRSQPAESTLWVQQSPGCGQTKVGSGAHSLQMRTASAAHVAVHPVSQQEGLLRQTRSQQVALMQPPPECTVQQSPTPGQLPAHTEPQIASANDAQPLSQKRQQVKSAAHTLLQQVVLLQPGAP